VILFILISRENSNTQFNFADFVLNAIATNHIGLGDYLVIDNSAVHKIYISTHPNCFVILWSLLNLFTSLFT
jgi:hypothetical protein